MRKHRIFIAINLPENIKKQLANFQNQWPELPAKWVRPENLHITLAFLGYILDEELTEVCGIVKEAARTNDSFFVNLNKVVYGPPKKIPPKMIWAEGEKSKELHKLQSDLEDLFFNESPNNFNNNKTNSFAPHITLGRIWQWDWSRIEPEELPDVNEEISFKFPVESIEIMESRLKKGGPEYMILESVKLGEI